MSKSHPYRVQLHCDKQMYSELNTFADQRGLSQSAASRLLIDRALLQRSDEVTRRLDRVDGYLEAILHASSTSRIFASEAAQCVGSTLTEEQVRERLVKLISRYKQF